MISPPSWPGRGTGGWSKGYFSTLLDHLYPGPAPGEEVGDVGNYPRSETRYGSVGDGHWAKASVAEQAPCQGHLDHPHPQKDNQHGSKGVPGDVEGLIENQGQALHDGCY